MTFLSDLLNLRPDNSLIKWDNIAVGDQLHKQRSVHVFVISLEEKSTPILRRGYFPPRRTAQTRLELTQRHRHAVRGHFDFVRMLVRRNVVDDHSFFCERRVFGFGLFYQSIFQVVQLTEYGGALTCVNPWKRFSIESEVDRHFRQDRK